MDAESKKYADEIDALDWMWLKSIEATNGWGLRLILEEAVPRVGPENPERDFVPDLAAQIRASMGSQRESRVFEILFSECIGYTVWNETYSLMTKAPEQFVGRKFRRFSHSYLLNMAQRNTYASQDHPGPGPLAHYEFVCQDDIVDVISCAEPTVRRL